MTRLMVYSLTCTSAVVMGAALLIARIGTDEAADTTGFMIGASIAFAAMAWWTWTQDN